MSYERAKDRDDSDSDKDIADTTSLESEESYSSPTHAEKETNKANEKLKKIQEAMQK